MTYLKRVVLSLVATTVAVVGLATPPAQSLDQFGPSFCLGHIWVADDHNGSFRWRNYNLPGDPYIWTNHWFGIQTYYFNSGKTCGPHKGVTSNVYNVYGWYKSCAGCSWQHGHVGHRQNFECGWITDLWRHQTYIDGQYRWAGTTATAAVRSGA